MMSTGSRARRACRNLVMSAHSRSFFTTFRITGIVGATFRNVEMRNPSYRVSPRTGAKLRSHVAVRKRDEGVVERGGARGVIENAFASVLDQRLKTRDRRRDDRQARGHVFKDFQRRPVEPKPQWIVL